MPNRSRRRVVVTAALMASLSAAAALRAGAAGAPDRSDPRHKRWRCLYESCTPYVYDPLIGEPVLRIRPGTPFEELPDDFVCPHCGRSWKDDFVCID